MNFAHNENSTYKSILDKTKDEKRLKTHSFHRYYGKLIPAIPRAFIREFTKVNDLIFDPFSGSGTTALESKYLDRNFLGTEINPLSIIMIKAKTNNYDHNILELIFQLISDRIKENNIKVSQDNIPFVINRDHWFKDQVQTDLVKIKFIIDEIIVDDILNEEEKEKYKEFLYGVLSAVVKNVSNADTQHVFPGVSKRIRKLEEEGKNNKDVNASFLRGLKKRINDVKELQGHYNEPNIINGDITNVDLSEFYEKVDLIVTNPPYISSVRYAETLKLELYWMEIIKNQEEYSDLSKSMIGNDMISKAEYEELYLTKYDFVNEYINEMYIKDKKNAKVIYDFFTLMEKAIEQMYKLLKPGKKVVMKISDSRIKKTKVETGRILTKIAIDKGFRLIDVFDDKINANSRSLTTARNTYSDIILHDNIIFWEKI